MASRLFIAVVLLASLSSGARAEREDPTENLNAERDALIDKIAHGVDYQASVQRFAALVKQRDTVVATSQSAKDREQKELALHALGRSGAPGAVDRRAL